MSPQLEANRQTLAEYRRRLEHISPQALTAVPPGETWSPGQVYTHILMVANFFSLDKATRALAKDPDPALGLNDGGINVFTHNSLPPSQFKMPDGVPAPPQPAHHAELLEAFDALDEGMAALANDLAVGLDRGGRTKHPFLGFLSAAEWFTFIDIHNRHHLRQLDRLTGGAVNGK